MIHSTMILAAFMAALMAPALAFAQSADTESDETSKATDAGAPAEIAVVENPASTDPVGTAKKLYDVIRSGEWLPAVGLVIMFLVFGLRRVLSYFVDWFATKRGGYLLAYASALGLTVGTALVAGEPFSFGLISTAIGAAWVASGGHDTLRDAIGKGSAATAATE